MKIAIVDDQIEFHSIIQKKLKSLEEYKLEYYTYLSVKDMEESLIHFDIVLLDIDMPDVDGIAYSKQNIQREIIFVSSQSHRAIEGYGINVHGFITKDETEETYINVMRPVLDRILNTQFIILKIEDEYKKFKVENIVYFQYIGDRTIAFVYENGQYLIRTMTLKEIEYQLNNQFVYIDRNVLVNISRIINIVNTKVVIRGVNQLFDISKRRIKEVKDKYRGR